MAQSLTNKNRLLEKYVQVVREDGLNTNKNVNIGINGSTPNLWVGGNITVGGTISGGSELTGAQTITATSANALSVGQNGNTNPTFNVNSNTASSATGLQVVSAAAGAGVSLNVLSSGASESLTIAPKGTGGGLFVNTAYIVDTSAGANALAVGPNGSTNPSFNVDASTASAATGLNIKTAAAGAGVAVTTTSSGSNENLTIAALGTGTVTFNPAVVAAAGGKASSGIQFGSLNVGLFTGTGAPSFSAMNGSIYVDSNATTTTTRIYVNKSGAGTAGTTWTNLTTAA